MKQIPTLSNWLSSINRAFLAFIACLCLLVVGLGEISLAQSADTDDDSWPTEIESKTYNEMPGYFKKTDNPVVRRYESLEQADRMSVQEKQANWAKQQAKKSKKGMFARKQKPVPLTDEQVTQVGPRETRVAQEPLLALPMGLQSESKAYIPAGFYLVRQQAVSAQERTWAIVKENVTLFTCQAKLTSNPQTNVASPITPVNPTMDSGVSPVMKVIYSPINPNQPQTATLVLVQNGERFESEPFQVMESKLPSLSKDKNP